MINARAETLDQKPAYRRLVASSRHRCLVLADGWYEWQRPEDPRQPQAAAALLAHRRGAVLLRRALDDLERARRPSGPELHDHHLPGERAGQADPRLAAVGEEGRPLLLDPDKPASGAGPWPR